MSTFTVITNDTSSLWAVTVSCLFVGRRIFTGENARRDFLGDVREKGSGPFFWRNFPWELTFHGENVGALSGVGVLIPTQDYKSLRAKNYHLTCPDVCGRRHFSVRVHRFASTSAVRIAFASATATAAHFGEGRHDRNVGWTLTARNKLPLKCS